MMIADTRRNPSGGAIFSVTTLTAGIKQVLESKYPIIWVEGEISNFRRPGSGHCYFTLKDDRARINAVMFAGQYRLLKFVLEDGLRVVGLGRITVYEPRGDYQIIFEQMMPKGAGELQAAFEQLKKELSARGWFSEQHKRFLPCLPTAVAIISSATGAVVHDMINVFTRRFPNIHIQIIPVAVQGEKAAPEIAAAIDLANQRAETEVLVVARGGGSLEDLAPFNSELVARAVFESRIPVVSAVGHETDFTICDFVADLRAPTPSAAAELIIPVKKELTLALERQRQRLSTAVGKTMQTLGSRLDSLSRRLIDPKRRIQDARLRLDDYCHRLARALARAVKDKKYRLQWQHQKLTAGLPEKFITGPARTLNEARDQLVRSTTLLYIRDNIHRLENMRQRLVSLDPKAVLSRGYSITRLLPEKRIVRNPDQVHSGDRLEIMVTDGTIYSTVTPAKGKTDEQ